MSRRLNWLQLFWIKLQAGKPFAHVSIIHNVTAHTIIQFKDCYISVLEDEEGIADLSWSRDLDMFPDVKAANFLRAEK